MGPSRMFGDALLVLLNCGETAGNENCSLPAALILLLKLEPFGPNELPDGCVGSWLPIPAKTQLH